VLNELLVGEKGADEVTNGLLARDVWREARAVARRAKVPWYKRFGFSLRVLRHWKKTGSLEDAVNDALSAYMWRHIS